MTARSLAPAVTLGVASALLACSSGPSESEFAAACIQEGQRGANRALSREMGIVSREKFCECTAKETKPIVSSDGYRWMMLDMQGKRQEAAALEAKMSENDRMEMAKAALTALGKCMGQATR